MRLSKMDNRSYLQTKKVWRTKRTSLALQEIFRRNPPRSSSLMVCLTSPVWRRCLLLWTCRPWCRQWCRLKWSLLSFYSNKSKELTDIRFALHRILLHCVFRANVEICPSDTLSTYCNLLRDDDGALSIMCFLYFFILLNFLSFKEIDMCSAVIVQHSDLPDPRYG